MKYSSYRKVVELLALRQAQAQKKVALVQSEEGKKALLSELHSISEDARELFYIEVSGGPDLPIIEDPDALSLCETLKNNLRCIRAVRSLK